MKKLYNVGLRETLEQLSTPELDDLLRAEAHKERPDEEMLKTVLVILRQREKDIPVVKSAETERAWETYARKTASRRSFRQSALVKAAAVVILCGLVLFALPRGAKAGSFFERITTWSDNFFELFTPDNPKDISGEYVFLTDHPGLQEVYDTVSGLGVADPVVPMWLDEGFVLEYCKKTVTPTTTKITACFTQDDREAVVEINVYNDNLPRQFHKSYQETEIYECDGIAHHILQNDDLWTIVWTYDNLECFMTLECQQNDVYRIIDSIYLMEE